jgi:RimJ/RimL family protein N-acetyltransferase
MRLNADTTLTLAPCASGSSDATSPPIRLVPYLPAHVPTYHAWMEDDALRAATGSERLSLEEEAAMQVAWRDDPDKLTFIILDVAACAAGEAAGLPRADAVVRAMVGDVNLFFQEEEEDADGEGGEDGREGRPGPLTTTAAEAEIMIAAPAARRRGFGRAALRLMLAYAARHCGLRRVTVKVGRGNTASLALFAGLGFRVLKDVPVFDERHLVLNLTEEDVLGSRGHAALAEEGWVEEAYGAWVERGRVVS